jgi:biotin-dependent carboxylase-like uncharacterized protein
MERDRQGKPGPVLEVVDPGLLLSIQDGGRPGLAAEGVTRGGAADAWSLAVANSLLGNPPDAAALEATLLGPTVRALVAVTVAVAGSMTGRLSSTGERVAAGMSATLAAGDVLTMESAGTGARGYLALPGGIDVPIVLGSRATALGAGFGGLDGRAIRAGDRVAARGAPGVVEARTLVVPRAHWPGEAAPDRVSRNAPLRLLPGPHADALGPEALAALVAGAWTVASASDRVGLRLDGTPLPIAPNAELPSHGVLAGTVQVPPDGRPIVLLADHQPTGGYPVIAVVVTADLPRLGQLAPGAAVAFRLVTPAVARESLLRADAAFARALAVLREAAGWDDLWHGAGG